MQRLEACADALLREKTVNNVIVRVGRGNEILFDLKRSTERQLTDGTLFDMASVSKIMATTTLALIAMDRGALSPGMEVARFFPVPKDKQGMTVHHLLTHTMGIGHKSLTQSTGGYREIQNYILSIPSDLPPGTDVRYSCPGFILLGRILEQIYGQPLDQAFAQWVTKPLGMTETTFHPCPAADVVNANLDDALVGVVNDYNCRFLGGVCGNAGVFSNLKDTTRFASLLLSRGVPLVSPQTFALAAQNHTPAMSESRGLGYLYVDSRYDQAGGLFADGAIGHCGHTGQSVFADPESGLYVIILSDATISTVKKYGREAYGEVKKMRLDLHAAIKEDLEEIGS